MFDEPDIFELQRHPHLQGAAGRAAREKDRDKDPAEEESTAAFGFLRGLDARALAVEFRFKDGNKTWFPYSWLGPWQYNPSIGLLLKFTGDVVSLVLIQGSNLDAQLSQHSVNLTDRGLQRHRITFIREMDEDELKKAAASEPTIDRITIAEFETVEDQREWLKKNAPEFIRKPQ